MVGVSQMEKVRVLELVFCGCKDIKRKPYQLPLMGGGQGKMLFLWVMDCLEHSGHCKVIMILFTLSPQLLLPGPEAILYWVQVVYQ